FVQRLRELGYVEGQNLTIDFRNAEGKLDRLPGLAAELARLKVNVIVTASDQATRAAMEATATIPILIVGVNFDPVALKFVTSLARPGTNLTGQFFLHLDLTVKRLSSSRRCCRPSNALPSSPISSRRTNSRRWKRPTGRSVSSSSWWSCEIPRIWR